MNDSILTFKTKRLRIEESLLLLIDFQEKLIPTMVDPTSLLKNSALMIEGARLFSVPILATEQYPKGLGGTLETIRKHLPDDFEFIPKLEYSCFGNEMVRQKLANWLSTKQIVIVGIETHICVLQTALDLLDQGFDVFLPVDALNASTLLKHETALKRLEKSGAILTTVESILFEWGITAENKKFKELSRLVKMFK